VLLGREPTRWGLLQLVDHDRMRQIVQPYLTRLGVDAAPETPVAVLSIAEQQLVEIARALSLDARVLIMDEPTSSLTFAETATLHDIVRGLRAEGVGIIYVSHRLDEVRTIADRAVVLRDGVNVGTLASEELTHDNMVRLMVGRDLDLRPPAPSRSTRAERLRVDRLRTRRYPRHALSFSVARGEIFGMAGLVGAGRSEVARAIFGIEPPLSGRVLVDDTPVDMADPAAAIRRGIFLVPEDRRTAGLVVEFSIRENVTLPALDRYQSRGIVSVDREREVATAVCRQLHVKAPSIETRTANLSGGNQQKVVLAKWLALGPQVLIVDEPTRGIDVGAKDDIYGLLRGLADAGVSIVMISSDMAEILHMSDRVAVMHEGTIAGVLDRAACTEERVLALAVGQSAM
jgi:ribose transport system ATP-binding protein